MECKICDKTFTGMVPFQDHVASEKHKRKVQLHKLSGLHADSLQPQSSSQTNRTQIASCPACSLAFNDISELIKHTMSAEHALMIMKKGHKNSDDGLISENSLESIIEPSSAGLEDDISQSLDESNMCINSSRVPYYSRCETCKMTFTGPEPYQMHIDSSAHKKKCACPSQDPTSSSMNNGQFKCDICNLYCTGLENYAQHIAGAAHRKKASWSSNGASSSSMTAWRCDICDIFCSGPAPYEQHMSSENHKKVVARRQLLSEMNGMKENGSVDGPKPKTSLMPNKLSPWYCEICDVPCSGPEPWKQHVESIKHRKKSIAHGKMANIEAAKKLISGDPDHNVQQFSTTHMPESNSGNINASKATDDLGNEIRNSVFGDNSYIKNVTPSDLEIATFKVDEPIDFDKNSTSNIPVSAVDMCLEEDGNDVKDDDDMDDDDINP